MAKGDKKRRFWSDVFLWSIVAYIIGVIIAIILSGETFDLDLLISDQGLWNWMPLALAGFVFILVLLNKATTWRDEGKKGKSKYSEKEDEEKQFYEGKLLTAQDLRKKFAWSMYSQLSKLDLGSKRDHLGDPYKGSGIVIKSELTSNGKDIEVVFGAPIHTLIIGNTGSGKGQGYIEPTLQIFSELPSKSSMAIGDLKGELYDKHSEKLRAMGYNVVKFDLKEPFKSDRWNPFDRCYNNYMRMINLGREVKVHTSGHPRERKLKFEEGANFAGTWYEFNGAAFPTKEEMEYVKKGEEQSIVATIAADVGDICNVIVPKGGSKEAMWEDGARDLCKAVIFSMLEDFKDPELGMTHEKFNLFNFYKIISRKDPGSNPFKTIHEYVKGRSPIFNVEELAGTVLNAPDTTKMSYVSVLGTAIGFLADPGIGYVTSGSEIDFRTFDQTDRPCAFFIQIPDEKITMHKIASIAFSQLYKDLTDLSNKNGGSLKRYFHFILDEFANIPKIEGIDGWVTISRSRKIIFHLVVQSYAQLITKYEENPAKAIKENCNIHIFVGSGDPQTLKEFSEKCGKTVARVENNSMSRQSDGKGGSTMNKTESENFQERPLVFPEQLQRIEKGTVCVVMDKTSPFFAKMGFEYKARHIYKIGNAFKNEYRPAKFLDEEKITYDITTYVKKRSGQNNQGGGGAPKPFNPFDD